MSGTTAVSYEVLADRNFPGTGQPKCPGCVGGFLHPYLVEFTLPLDGWQGVDYLTGWVAVCVGNDHDRRARPDVAADVEVPACGFSMPLTPHYRKPFDPGSILIERNPL